MAKAKTGKTAAPQAKPVSKQTTVIAMLRRPEGASIPEIVEVTGWAPHSVRGFMSGALKKRLHIEVTSQKRNGEERRYFVGTVNSME